MILRLSCGNVEPLSHGFFFRHIYWFHFADPPTKLIYESLMLQWPLQRAQEFGLLLVNVGLIGFTTKLERPRK